MKAGVLFSGGKDSTYATYIAKKEGHEISCLISVFSENKESYMFHTPSISGVEVQAKKMGIPLIFQRTKGVKEEELLDLELIIEKVRDEYDVEGIVTGAVGSVYQASRIEKICRKLGLECINPLWGKNQVELLRDLVKGGFRVVIIGVFAYPLGREYLGREVDEDFILETERLYEKYKINPAGEGGEFESFVLDCPLFKSPVMIENFEDFGEGNSWRRELVVR